MREFLLRSFLISSTISPVHCLFIYTPKPIIYNEKRQNSFQSALNHSVSELHHKSCSHRGEAGAAWSWSDKAAIAANRFLTLYPLCHSEKALQSTTRQHKLADRDRQVALLHLAFEWNRFGVSLALIVLKYTFFPSYFEPRIAKCKRKKAAKPIKHFNRRFGLHRFKSAP